MGESALADSGDRIRQENGGEAVGRIESGCGDHGDSIGDGDGGEAGAAAENKTAGSGPVLGIAKGRELGTVLEGPGADGFHAVRKLGGGQSGAALKGAAADGGQAIGKLDLGQIVAACKGAVPDGSHRRGDGQPFDCCVVLEGAFSDGGHRVPVQLRRQLDGSVAAAVLCNDGTLVGDVVGVIRRIADQAIGGEQGAPGGAPAGGGVLPGGGAVGGRQGDGDVGEKGAPLLGGDLDIVFTEGTAVLAITDDIGISCNDVPLGGGPGTAAVGKIGGQQRAVMVQRSCTMTSAAPEPSWAMTLPLREERTGAAGAEASGSSGTAASVSSWGTMATSLSKAVTRLSPEKAEEGCLVSPASISSASAWAGTRELIRLTISREHIKRFRFIMISLPRREFLNDLLLLHGCSLTDNTRDTVSKSDNRCINIG